MKKFLYIYSLISFILLSGNSLFSMESSAEVSAVPENSICELCNKRISDPALVRLPLSIRMLDDAPLFLSFNEPSGVARIFHTKCLSHLLYTNDMRVISRPPCDLFLHAVLTLFNAQRDQYFRFLPKRFTLDRLVGALAVTDVGELHRLRDERIDLTYIDEEKNTVWHAAIQNVAFVVLDVLTEDDMVLLNSHNVSGYTPLHSLMLVARNNRENGLFIKKCCEALKKLIGNRAKIDEKVSRGLDSSEFFGLNALQLSVLFDIPAFVKILLQTGADPCVLVNRDFVHPTSLSTKLCAGDTIVHIAAKIGSLASLKVIRKCSWGAVSTDAENVEGLTPSACAGENSAIQDFFSGSIHTVEVVDCDGWGCCRPRVVREKRDK